MRKLSKSLGASIIVCMIYIGQTAAVKAWAPPIPVTHSLNNATFPATALDHDGLFHVVWQENSNNSGPEEIFYRSGDGTTWNTAINLSQSSARSLYADVVVTQQKQVIVTWVEFEMNTHSTIYYASNLEGTWSKPAPLSVDLLVGMPILAIHDETIIAAWPADTDGDLYADAIFHSLWQGSSGWSTPQPFPLTTGTLDTVDLVFDSQGNLHLVWNGNTSGHPADLSQYEIMYSTYNGISWSAPVNISQLATYSFWPTLAVDTTGQFHVLWAESLLAATPGVPLFDRILYQRLSADGWLPQPIQLSTNSGVQFPKAQVDTQGRAHFVWMENNSTNPAVFAFRLQYRRWNGTTVSHVVPIAGQPSDKNQIKADLALTLDGHVSAIWAGGNETGVSQIYHSQLSAHQVSLTQQANSIADFPTLAGKGSTDLHLLWVEGMEERQLFYSRRNGSSWTNPQGIAPSIGALTGSMALGLAGEPHVVWYTPDIDGDHIRYSQLTETGWLSPTELALAPMGGSFPHMATDHQGDVHVVWHGLPDTQTDDFAIYYRKRAGTTWLPVEQLSPASHNSDSPRIAVDGAGHPHVVWYDVREQEIYYTQRDENGWHAPQNISHTELTIPYEASHSQGPDIDVDQIGHVHIAWLDTTNGALLNAVNYTAKVGEQWSSSVVMTEPGQTIDIVRNSGTVVRVLAEAADNVHVLWHNNDAAGRPTVYHSRRSGTGWSSPTILLNEYQFALRPDGYLDTQGSLHLVWTELQTIRQIFYQRLDRFDWIKVEDERGQPLAGSLVYRNGQAIGTTDQRGVFLPPTLQAGDQLATLAPIYEQSTIRSAHTSPDTPDRNWAYRIYLTHWSAALQETPQAHSVIDPTREQRLIMQRASPLVLFNLLISLEWRASPEYLAEMQLAVQQASNYLYDLTDGQMAFGQVAIYDGGRHWTDADIQIAAKNNVRPYSYIGGILSADRSYVMRLGRRWDGKNGAQGSWSEPDGYRTLIHEFGHYALSLYDEYFAYLLDQNGTLQGIVDTWCTTYQPRINPNHEATNASAMDYQYASTEFSARNVTGLWSADCANTLHFQEEGESTWETFTRHYADQASPARWQFVLPAERGTILAGPTALPQFLPQFPIVTLPTQTGQPNRQDHTLTVVRLDDTPAIQATVTLYTQLDDRLVGIAQGFTNQQGQITVYGAALGDMIQATVVEAGLTGSVKIGDTENLTLQIQPVVQAMARDMITPTLPYLHIAAEPGLDPNQIDLNIALHNLGNVDTLDTFVTIPGSDTSYSPLLTYDSATDTHAGKVSFSATQRGMGRIRMLSSNTSTITRLAADYQLQQSLNHQAQDIYSADGNLALHLEVGSLVESNGYWVVAPLNALPGPLPEGLRLVGDNYAITASGARIILEKPALLKLYYPTSAISGQQALGIYFWDSRQQSWQAVTSQVNREQNAVVATITKLGIYAVLAVEPITQPVFLPLIFR